MYKTLEIMGETKWGVLFCRLEVSQIEATPGMKQPQTLLGAITPLTHLHRHFKWGPMSLHFFHDRFVTAHIEDPGSSDLEMTLGFYLHMIHKQSSQLILLISWVCLNIV